jgi:SAM-dependent methyltransferase
MTPDSLARPILRREQLADRYSADAATYDRIWSPVILPAAQSLAPALQLEEARRVVDVGAGAGALAPAIRIGAPRASVIGVDASEGMLRIARASYGLPAAVADAAALPIPTRSVDAVVLAFVLFHLSDPDAGLDEAARVVRPGGRVGTVTWAEEHPTRASVLWDDALDAAGAPRPPERGHHQGLDSPTAMGDRLQRAGLHPTDAWTEAVAYTFTPGAFWALRVGFGNPRWRLEQLDRASRDTLVRRLHDRSTRLDPDDFRFRGSVVLAVAARG